MNAKKQITSGTKFIQLSKDELPMYFTEQVYGNKWVKYGTNDQYMYYLRDLYLNSPTHGAIIDSQINLSTGEGITINSPETNPISNKFIIENFPKEVIKNMLSDLILYGFSTVQVFSGNVVRYTEAIKYRLDKMSDDGNIDYIWFSNDWQNYSYKKNNPVKLPIYKEGSDEELQIAIVQLEKHGFDYYSPVSYQGCVDYVDLECQIAEYHLANVKNGIFPSFLVNMIGNFSDADMEQIEKSIYKKFGGATAAGRIIVGFSSDPNQKTTLDTIEQPDLPATYQFLTTECTNKILIGHGVTSPLIHGVRIEGGGGLGSNSEELQQSYYLYYETKLKHFQNYILELVTKIMRGNLLFAKPEFITYNPFAVTDNTQKLSKHEELNEVNSQKILNKIEEIKYKTSDFILNSNIFDGNLKDDMYYQFVKCGDNGNIISKKFELLSKQGFVFKADELIKNTKDYYFNEISFLKK